MLDFAGVEAASPSFLDELLGRLRDSVQTNGAVRLVSTPGTLGGKLRAIGRGRGIAVQQEAEADWRIEFPPELSAPST